MVSEEDACQKSPGEAGEVAFNYDGMGKRRNKLVDGTETTWWRWDAGWGMIAEYGGDGSWTVGDRTSTLIHDADNWTGIGTGLASVEGTNPSTSPYQYFAQDVLGSLRGLFDEDASLTGAADYDPYGSVRVGVGPAALPQQMFTGQMFDLEISQYYFPERYYSPITARWLSREPSGLDGPNLYHYTFGNPTNWVDYHGEFCLVPAVLIGIGVTLGIGWTLYSGWKALKRGKEKAQDIRTRQADKWGKAKPDRGPGYTDDELIADCTGF